MKPAIRFRGLVRVMIAVMLLVSVTTHAQTTKPAVVDMAAVVKVGAAAREKFKTNGAHWLTTITTPGDPVTLTAEWDMFPAGFRVAMNRVKDGHAAPWLTIVSKDKFWFVTDGDKHTKWLAYAYPFAEPRAMLLLWLSLPRTADSIRPGGVLVPGEDGMAIYRGFMHKTDADNARDQIKSFDQSMQRQLDLLDPTDPILVDDLTRFNPEFKAQIAESLERLADRFVSRFDLGSGLMVDNLTGERKHVVMHNFRWLDGDGVDVLDVSKPTWEDHSAGPASADLPDLVMLNFRAIPADGQPPFRGDTDCRIVNIRTGEMWRAPFSGISSKGGNFFPDRKRIASVAADFDNGGNRPAVTSLDTTGNQQLRCRSLPAGLNQPAVVSRDGRWLAVRNAAATWPMAEQMYVVDLDANQARCIGPADGLSSASWLADGSGIIVQRDTEPDGHDPDGAMICCIRLDGTLNELGRGIFPRVCPDTHRIVFGNYQGNGRIFWSTCDIAGHDVRRIGDGLPTAESVAMSPDGNRLIVVNKPTGKQRHPLPVVLELPAMTPHVVPVGEGIWSDPVW